MAVTCSLTLVNQLNRQHHKVRHFMQLCSALHFKKIFKELSNQKLIILMSVIYIMCRVNCIVVEEALVQLKSVTGRPTAALIHK